MCVQVRRALLGFRSEGLRVAAFAVLRVFGPMPWGIVYCCSAELGVLAGTLRVVAIRRRQRCVVALLASLLLC